MFFDKVFFWTSLETRIYEAEFFFSFGLSCIIGFFSGMGSVGPMPPQHMFAGPMHTGPASQYSPMHHHQQPFQQLSHFVNTANFSGQPGMPPMNPTQQQMYQQQVNFHLCSCAWLFHYRQVPAFWLFISRCHSFPTFGWFGHAFQGCAEFFRTCQSSSLLLFLGFISEFRAAFQWTASIH